MANAIVIEGLQIIVTDLAQQADGHALQSRIFAAEGFTKLAEKYAEHAKEERDWVEKCADRLLDLGVDIKLEAKKEGPVYKDLTERVKYDLEVSKAGLAWLKEIAEEAREDYTTFDILKEYYQAEEEDMYWGELGRKVHLDSGTLAPLLKRLEKQGLINRTRPEYNESKLMISLTEQGEALKDKATSVPRIMDGCIPLTNDELSLLKKLLDKALVNMS